jgi:hypothetical protein
MNCVERLRRENSMLGSFLNKGKLFLDDDGRVIAQFENVMAQSLLDDPKNRAAFCRAIAPEIKKTVSPADLLVEIPTGQESVKDTVLDDLLEAAGEST